MSPPNSKRLYIFLPNFLCCVSVQVILQWAAEFWRHHLLRCLFLWCSEEERSKLKNSTAEIITLSVKIMHRPGCGQFYVEPFSVQQVILHRGIVECLLLPMDWRLWLVTDCNVNSKCVLGLTIMLSCLLSLSECSFFLLKSIDRIVLLQSLHCSQQDLEWQNSEFWKDRLRLTIYVDFCLFMCQKWGCTWFFILHLHSKCLKNSATGMRTIQME